MMLSMSAEQSKRRGRPPTPEGERLVMRSIRMSDQEWQMADAAASAAGVKLSQWIRAAIIRAAKRSSKKN